MSVCRLYPSLVPRPFEGKAWGLLRAHALKISFIFRIIHSECVQVVSYIDLWSSFNFLFNTLRVI